MAWTVAEMEFLALPAPPRITADAGKSISKNIAVSKPDNG
jgi:hypothetical protein